MAQTAKALELRTSFRARLHGLHVVSRRSHASPRVGPRRSRQRGASIEFADYRRYSPGDDVRQIDWNVYARSDRLFIKVREAEEALGVYILVDCSGSMDRGADNKLGYARELAAALAYVALSDGEAVTLAGFGDHLRESVSGAGPGQIDRVLEFLEGLEGRGETSFEVSMREFGARRAPTGVLFLISDLMARDGLRGLGALGEMGHEVVMLHVLDREADISPAVGDDVEVVDCETGRKLVIPPDVRPDRLYEQNFHAWLEDIRGACARSRTRYLAVETGWPVEEVVLGRLRAAKVLA